MVGAKRAARFTSRMSNERSADELRPRMASPAGLSLATWRLGRARSVFELWGQKLVRASGNAPELGTHLVRLRL